MLGGGGEGEEMRVNYLYSENSWSAHSLVDSFASGILEEVIHRTLVVEDENENEKFTDAKFVATIEIVCITDSVIKVPPLKYF